MWVSKEDYVEAAERSKNLLESAIAWQETFAAQLKAISDSQARLEVNVGERLAALEKEINGDAVTLSLSDQLNAGFTAFHERLVAIEGRIDQRWADTQRLIKDGHASQAGHTESCRFDLAERLEGRKGIRPTPKSASRAKPSKRRKAA